MSAADTRMARVLVFDDDLVRHPELFAELPCEVTLRGHADDCVEAVEELAPDLVLMDFSMGAKLNGRDAVMRLRQRYPLGALTIVGISSDARMNRLMLEAGADDAIVKGALVDNLRLLLPLLPDVSQPGARPPASQRGAT